MNKQLLAVSVVVILTGISFLSVISENVVAAPGWITVYSPSSGATYYEGNTIYINWNSADIGNYVRIELYKTGYLFTTISSNTSNDGSYSWTIPNGYSSSSYYTTRVTSISYPSDYDDSDHFYINDKSITVTSPNTGQTLYQGDTHTIRWASENTGYYFKIDLYKSGSYVKTITSSKYSYGDYGSYSWMVPSDLPISSSYKIKITDTSDGSVYGYSGEFSIDKRSIKITSPAGSETWFKGETYTITWTSKNAGNQVSIKYKKEHAYYYSTIDLYESNDGIYEWTIPTNLDLNYNYQIKITSNSYSNVDDISKSFSIDERYIDISSPSWDDKWLPNETHVIEWTSKNAGNQVDIWLLKNDAHYATIATNINNSGSYSWKFQNIFDADSDYKIQIMSKEYNSVYDQSEEFTIGGQTIAITSPANGDTWYKGEAYTITWTSKNAGDYVNIKLYKNGDYYYTIASNVENNGEHKWNKISSDISSDSSYRIRIDSTSYNNIYGLSEGSFTIEETFLQKISGPILIIAIIGSIILVAAVIFFKLKKKWLKSKEDASDTTNLEASQAVRNNKVINQNEYEHIWEEK